MLRRLWEVLPGGVQVTILPDRGFGEHKLYDLLSQELGFGYIIRFKDNIYVTDETGQCQQARDWVPTNGRVKVLRQAQVTAQGYVVPTVVCVKKKDMKEAWCLAVSDPQAKGAEVVKLYGKRWGVEIDQPCCLHKSVLLNFPNNQAVIDERVSTRFEVPLLRILAA